MLGPIVLAILVAGAASGGSSTVKKDHLAGGASGLPGLLLPQVHRVFTVVAPCHPGAALPDLALLHRGRATGPSGITQPTATQQPSTPPVQATAEKPWPPPGVVRASVGVVSPRLIKESRVNYLPMALREKITGVIELEAVVETDGTVSEVRVTRSLDRKFGLDDEAVETLKKWQFAPGEKDGIVVPVLIQVEMWFSIRK